MTQRVKDSLRGVETLYSKKHAERAGDKDCWICLLPLGNTHAHDDLRRSRDHVIPRAHGGAFLAGNTRWAHRWCNAKRGKEPITGDLAAQIKKRMLKVHWKWFARALDGKLTTEQSRQP